MKVLLVNPNRYHFPPVPPIGLEQLAGALEREGQSAEIIDLCFSTSVFEDLDKAVADFSPDIAGVTIRNVDTVLYQTNEFFLDGIREIIEHIKRKHGLEVVIGGAGISTNPEAILDYVKADYAVAGPGEEAINGLLDHIASSKKEKRIFCGDYRYEISCPRKRSGIDYTKYFTRGAVAGFETHKGCGSSCVYCSEANTKVSFKKIDDVITEIKGFADDGFRRFHLCDSEFNEDLDYCIDFCAALKNSRMEIDWAVYMKPANYNKKLFRLMKETGVSLITLTVDSWKKCTLYWQDIEKMIFNAKSAGIRTAVDFLAGFPYEDEETFSFYLNLFRRTGPDSVGINTYIRLYKSLLITKTILADDSLRDKLIGNTSDHTLVTPVFFNQLKTERVAELIGSDGNFRIEGLERGVNYVRAVEKDGKQ